MVDEAGTPVFAVSSVENSCASSVLLSVDDPELLPLSVKVMVRPHPRDNMKITGPKHSWVSDKKYNTQIGVTHKKKWRE